MEETIGNQAYWNDECEECNEEILVEDVYVNTVMQFIDGYLRKGNSGTGKIEIDGVMKVTLNIEIL